jgi:hypothetical protein
VLTVVGYAGLAVLLVGGLFLLASKLLPAGEQLAPPVRDEPIWNLPADRPIRAQDVAVVRLPVAMRGYRFAETDRLLDRLAEELRVRDEEIARLGGGDAPHVSMTENALVADALVADALVVDVLLADEADGD